MRNSTRSLIVVSVASTAALFCGPGAAQTVPPAAAGAEICCNHPQSPRPLTPAVEWNYTSTIPTVHKRDDDSVYFEPRVGVRQILYRCSQHYHCKAENVQGCPGESPIPDAEKDCPAHPTPGTLVEIHTVYHLGPLLNPTPEGLDRCIPGSLVVVGYAAKVTQLPSNGLVPLHFGPPAAEWTGSATNVDLPPPPAPPECKVAAFWHFALGCNFEVTEHQLAMFTHPDGKRMLQPQERRSRDLTRIVSTRKAAKP
jgi:hypothetical protein